MARCWSADKRWSDRFSPHIQAILGSLFFKPADKFEDQKRNTDFDMEFCSPGGIRVAARVRKQEGRWLDYLAGGEFTVRASRPSGVPTELHKIREGWGQFMFYGFAHVEGDHVGNWVVLNLAAFAGQEPELPFETMGNKDGSSTFRVYSTRDLSAHTVHAAFMWPALTPAQAAVAVSPSVVPVTRIEQRRRETA